MKKVMYFDQSGYTRRIAEIENAIPALQAVLDELNSLDVLKVKTPEELSQVITGGESFIKDRLAEAIPENTLSLGIFKLSRTKAIELAELPSFDKLNELCTQCKPEDLSAIQFLTIRNGQLQIDPAKEQELRDKATLHADTPQRQRTLEAHERAAKAIEQFKKELESLIGIDPMFPHTELRSLFRFSDTGEVTVLDYFYERNRGAIIRHEQQQ